MYQNITIVLDNKIAKPAVVAVMFAHLLCRQKCRNKDVGTTGLVFANFTVTKNGKRVVGLNDCTSSILPYTLTDYYTGDIFSLNVKGIA